MTDVSRYSDDDRRCKGIHVFMTYIRVDAEGIRSIKAGCTATKEIVHTLPSVAENDGTDSQTSHLCFMISS